MKSILNSLINLAFAILFVVPSSAQTTDTLTVMTYNLMYYRETTSFCTSTNNNTLTKENAMEDIIDHVIPDILVVNEMGGSSPVNSFRLMTNSLNQNGRTFYNLANNSGNGSNLVNMLYYNDTKLTLEGQSTVTHDLSNNALIRVIDIYTLRYDDPNLAQHQDTTRIHVIAAHLKAGSTTADINEREDAAEALMAHLDTINATGNYILAGDFNIARSTEAAYRDFTNYIDPTLRFFDPVNVPGNWSNNAPFAILHTQSTRTTGGCFAGGGMDDRFDFILVSDEIMNNTDKVEYISNTYEALGQDGLRFNNTIIFPTNSSVPTAVSQALYNMSDHLPVVMDVKVTLPNPTSIEEISDKNSFKLKNPTANQLYIDARKLKGIRAINMYNLAGQLSYESTVNDKGVIIRDISSLKQGTYIVHLIGEKSTYVNKLIKL